MHSIRGSLYKNLTVAVVDPVETEELGISMSLMGQC